MRCGAPESAEKCSFIILVTATTVVIIYPLLALRLRRQREGSVPDVVAYKMLAYPPAYLLLVLPIAIYRAFSLRAAWLTAQASPVSSKVGRSPSPSSPSPAPSTP